MTTINLYSLDTYSFGQKAPLLEKDTSVPARLARMYVVCAPCALVCVGIGADVSVDRCRQEKYEVEGMRRTVEGVLLVHQYNHPHVLLLQIGNSFFKLYVMCAWERARLLCRLLTRESRPGGRLRPGESETDGLKRKLTTKLAPDDPTYQPEWENGQLVCSWWRHHFEQTTPFVRGSSVSALGRHRGLID